MYNINKLAIHFDIIMHYRFELRIYLTIVLLMLTILFPNTVLSNKNFLNLINAAEMTMDKSPVIFDSSLKIELIFQKEINRRGGTLSPISSFAFLDRNDILLLNKNEGIVNRIVNGVLLQVPLLDVNVANKRERGMLGIATISSIASNID